MNREIKLFRAWNGKEMLKDYDLPGMQGSFVNLNEVIENAIQNDYVLLQDTGAKDKNEKPIGQSDIVKVLLKNEYGSHEEHVGEVVYVDSIAMYNIMIEWHGGRLGFEFYKFNSIEVIGNIYENPELLPS